MEGVLRLKQEGAGAPVDIKGFISGLTAGKHGLHVHRDGRLGNGCKDAGGHYNPLSVSCCKFYCCYCYCCC